MFKPHLVGPAVTALLAAAAVSAHAQPPATSGGALPAFNWTGPYVGVNAGYDFDGATRFDRTVGQLPNNTTALALNLRPTSHTTHGKGFAGGLQVGYNHQFSERYSWGGAGLVIGAEADAQYMDVHRTDVLSNTTNYGPLDVPNSPPTTRVNEYKGDLDFLGTVRGRLGFAYDTMLVYGTGGFAYGDVQRRTTYYGPNAPGVPFFTGQSNGMRSGYAYGGGLEYAVPTGSFLDRFNFFHATGVTVRAEYLHYDLGSDTLVFPGVNGGSTIGGYASRVRTDGDLVRAGVNYKF